MRLLLAGYAALKKHHQAMPARSRVLTGYAADRLVYLYDDLAKRAEATGDPGEAGLAVEWRTEAAAWRAERAKYPPTPAPPPRPAKTDPRR